MSYLEVTSYEYSHYLHFLIKVADRTKLNHTDWILQDVKRMEVIKISVYFHVQDLCCYKVFAVSV